MEKTYTPSLKPTDILSKDDIQYLRTKSDLKGLMQIAHAWIVILGCLFVYTLFPNVITFALAVILIAGRQLGLAILMHEGAHGLITNNTKTNNKVSQWLCAFPVWSDTYGYRHYHLSHHRMPNFLRKTI